MRKVFLKYFLTLCVFIINGYGTISADTYNGSASVAIKRLSTSEHVNYYISHVNQIPSYFLYSLELEKKIEIDAVEIAEEEVFLSVKKYLQISKFFKVFLFACILGFFFGPLKNGLLFCKHIFYTTLYCWYIIFRVIRL